MPLIEIDSIDDARLEPYRDVRNRNLTRNSGLFIAEGRLLVERLLRSDLGVHSILVASRHADECKDRIVSEIPVFVIPDQHVDSLLGFHFHRGVLACGHRPEDATLADLFAQENGNTTIVIGSGIQDPENLGSIVRSCAAFGIDLLVLGQGCADPYSRRALRVSMGNAFHQPILQTHDLSAVLNELRNDWDVEIAATVLDNDAEHLDSASRAKRFALLFGGEGFGLEAELVAQCDRKITMPMSPNTDSLNVAVAAGVFLYHFTRNT